MNRRAFTKEVLALVANFALLESIVAHDAIPLAIKPNLDKWLKELNTYCADLKKQAITPLEWQDFVAQLFRTVDLNDVLKATDFAALRRVFELPDLGVKTRAVKFPGLSGLPEKVVFTSKIFGMKKGRAIIPHGHSNMVSAHFILEGSLHLRHYNKVFAEQGFLTIEPTVDRIVGAGDYSSISEERDNIHWFIAESDRAFTFDVIMLDLAGESYNIHNLDMEEQQACGDGTLRVPVLGVQEALLKYGKSGHH